jgi:hypothetical protein
MAKKGQKPKSFTYKPTDTSNSSLASNSHRTEASAISTQQLSVIEQLAHLRATQGRPSQEAGRHLAAIAESQTVHPSLQSLLGISRPPAPRPRPGTRGYRRALRTGPPGPPPPPSWSSLANDTLRHNEGPNGVVADGDFSFLRPLTTNRFPGSISLPSTSSLQHYTLIAMARYWEWHTTYDQHYLADLPPRLKSSLLSYVSVYGGENLVTLGGLQVLFLDDDVMEGTSNCEDVTHLDLSTSIGRSISLKELGNFISEPAYAPQNAALEPSNDLVSTAEPADGPTDDIADTWELQYSLPRLSLDGPRFSNLTHLSLSCPSASISWKSLLKFSTHMATITHLSLAYWPVPTLTPKSRTTKMTSRYGNYDAGGTNFYSHTLDGDWTEARVVLKLLSKATYCLKWLDLEGCIDWWAALKSEEVTQGADWTGSWRNIEVLKLGQRVGPHPDHMKEHLARSKDTLISLSPNSDEYALWWSKPLRDWIAHEIEAVEVATAIRRIRKRGPYPRILLTEGEDAVRLRRMLRPQSIPEGLMETWHSAGDVEA